MDMQTPNKEARLKHYREVLDFYNSVDEVTNSEHAMCILLGGKLFGSYISEDCPADVIEAFYPELNEQRPVVLVPPFNFWFLAKEKQSIIKCLEAAIKLCEASVD